MKLASLSSSSSSNKIKGPAQFQNNQNDNKAKKFSKGGSEGEEELDMESDDDSLVDNLIIKSSMNTSNATSKERRESGYENSRLPHKCSRCQRRFPNVVTLNVHEEVHNEFEEARLQKEAALREYEEKSQSQPGGVRPYQCIECLRTFGRLDHLDRHLRTHKELLTA